MADQRHLHDTFPKENVEDMPVVRRSRSLLSRAFQNCAGRANALHHHALLSGPAQRALRRSRGRADESYLLGDNMQVISHLLKEFRGKVDLEYIDPPFDPNANYKKKIELHGNNMNSEYNSFEEK